MHQSFVQKVRSYAQFIIISNISLKYYTVGDKPAKRQPFSITHMFFLTIWHNRNNGNILFQDDSDHFSIKRLCVKDCNNDFTSSFQALVRTIKTTPHLNLKKKAIFSLY